jgi:uncharacterized protein (TIGR02466 family)
MKQHIISPTVIAESYNPKHKTILNSLKKFIKNSQIKNKNLKTNWISKDTFNTLHNIDINTVSEFKNLNTWVYQQVDIYKTLIGYVSPMKPNGAWFNVYYKNNFQEYHSHYEHDISAIYFLKSNNKSAKTFFQSPLHDIAFKAPFNENVQMTYHEISFLPIQGNLLIFPGYLKHCVEMHKQDKTRISCAYNFNA